MIGLRDDWFSFAHCKGCGMGFLKLKYGIFLAFYEKHFIITRDS